MVNLSSEMKKYYIDNVVVRKTIIDELREKKKINIDRLKEGLSEYNEENNTKYKIIENFEQGSVAMSTMIQSESNDYDIDVAIVLEKELLKDKGCTATKNIIEESLKKKAINFKNDPEAKTNCVRVYYDSGYHLDFAIFRNEDDNYEHCGREWSERNPRDINNWFKNNNEDNRLRIFTRLLKTFCRSRESWIMPGGLMITILVNEALGKITIADKYDEDFISIIREIKNRLYLNKEILNPITNQTLMMVQEDYTKVTNLYTRLNEQLQRFNDITEDNKDSYKQFWCDFFNDDFWTSVECNGKIDNFEYDELYVENFYKTKSDLEIIEIKCFKPIQKFNTDALRKYACSFSKKIKVCKDENFIFYIEGSKYNSNNFYFLWKIKNRGTEAENYNCIRGQLELSNYREGISNHLENINYKERYESSSYLGSHIVECYIVDKGFNRIVAKGRYDVEID